VGAGKGVKRRAKYESEKESKKVRRAKKQRERKAIRY
jgi:hypothetical protein